MANWKKVLVSGSQIEVQSITASAIPETGGSNDRVLVLGTNGEIESRAQSDVQGVTTAVFKISGSTGKDTFDSTGDSLLVTGSSNTINVSASVNADSSETTLTLDFADTVLSSSNQIATEITGAFTLVSQSLSASISTNVVAIDANATSITNVSNSIASDIAEATASIVVLESEIDTNATNIAKGIRFQTASGTSNTGSSIGLGGTASFAGTNNEVEVSQSVSTDGTLFTFGLPDDVTIGGDLTVSDNLSVLGIELVEGQTSVVSGAVQFGSGSTLAGIASLGNHQFTGSVEITGSVVADGTITAGTLNESTEDALTNIVVHTSTGELQSAGTNMIATLSALTGSNLTAITAATNSIQSITASISQLDNEVAGIDAAVTGGINFGTPSATGHSISLLETASFSASIGLLGNQTATPANTFTVTTQSSNTVEFVLGSNIFLNSGIVSGSAQIDVGETTGTTTAKAFKNIKGHSGTSDITTIVADAAEDTLVISASDHVTISAVDGTSNTLTISSTDEDVNITNLVARLDDINIPVTIGNGTSTHVTASGNLKVKKDVLIEGDLTILGNAERTSIRTTNLEIEDQFILINSGALGVGNNNDKDGGFVFDTGNNTGTAFYYDFNNQAFAIRGADQNISRMVSGSVVSGDAALVPDLFVNTVSQSVSDPSAAPAYGDDSNTTNRGSMHVNTSTEEIFIYA